VYNVEIECADRRAFENGRDTTYDDEVNAALTESVYDSQEISRRHFERGSLRPN